MNKIEIIENYDGDIEKEPLSYMVGSSVNFWKTIWHWSVQINDSLWWTIIPNICDSCLEIEAFSGKVAAPIASEEWHMTKASGEILSLWPHWLMMQEWTYDLS